MLAKIARDPRPTTGNKSEKDLAIAMGYPKNWRVVRRLITITSTEIKKNDDDPETTKIPKAKITTLQDRIYAGNPKRNVDMYFNHDAARQAVIRLYRDYGGGNNNSSSNNGDDDNKPTPYSDKGGQLLPRVSLYKKNDLVEVYYEPDDEWYHATIIKKTEYDDDIRYTVHYIVEDSTQTNVSEEDIRYATTDPPKPKAKAKKQATKKSPKSAVTGSVKKRGRPSKKKIDYIEEVEESEEEDDDDDEEEEEETTSRRGRGRRARKSNNNNKRYRPRSSTSKRIKYKDPDDNDEFDVVVDDEEEKTKAKRGRGRGRPPSKREHQEETEHLFEDDDEDSNTNDGQAVADDFHADDVAYASALSLGMPSGWKAKQSANGQWSLRGPDGERFRSLKKAQDYVNSGGGGGGGGKDQDGTSDVGDPPWRTTDHAYINKRVRYVHKHKCSARREVDIEQHGTVLGYISETDVDKNGEPGFISEQTNKPAKLFHVVFDSDPNHDYVNHLLTSKDFEGYELEEIFVAEENE